MSKLTDKQKARILKLTGMSKELLEESINNNSLIGFGGNDSAENFSDRFNYSIDFHDGYCLVDMWHRMTSDSKWKVFNNGASKELSVY